MLPLELALSINTNSREGKPVLKKWDEGPRPAFPPVHKNRVRIRFRHHEIDSLGYLIASHRLGSLAIESPSPEVLTRAHASRMWGNDAFRTVTIRLEDNFNHNLFWARMAGALDRIEAVPVGE